ncbi:MAG: hypothetical protein KC549_17375 [Myxococcales bacterium]|nr:hypothetical protein [Myxococcales bacterium]MCB9549068.1 hypothetical protein [Myxococcales bacterium]
MTTPPPAPPATFRFRYAVFTVQVELTPERLSTRTGLRTTLLPVPRLEHLWVKRERGADHEELLLTWRTARGKQRRVRIFADKGEPAFAGLVEALVAARPEIDRRGESAASAYRLAGARELEWAVLPGIMVVGLAVVAFLLSPLLRHGVDDGFAAVPVERLLQAPPLATRNVEVAALPLLDRAARGQAGADRKLETASLWIPLVPEGSDPDGDAPVPAVLEVRGLRGVDLDALVAQRRFRGVVRDLGWEGLSDARQRSLEERGNTLALHVKLIEYRADAQADLTLAVGILGFLSLLVAATTAVLWRRRRR